MTKLENALVWLYIKTWGKFGDHVIEQKALWNFGTDDLDTVIMSLILPRKKEKTERVKALTDLIMEKFEQGGLTAFREWSGEIHDQIIETLPEAAEQKNNGKHVFKHDPNMPLKIGGKFFQNKQEMFRNHVIMFCLTIFEPHKH